MSYPNKKDQYGVCSDCTRVNLQEPCKGCGRKPSSMKCEDCSKHLGGGFRFKESHRSGVRCFECLDLNMKKEKGWQALDQISEELRNIPNLKGRKWKAYALELKAQRSTICHIAAIYQASKPDFID